MARRTKRGTSPQMDGNIFDWFRRVVKRVTPPVPGPPSPEERPLGLPAPKGGALIPAEPMLPAPPPEQVRLPSIFEAFGPPAVRPAPREAPMIFHAFPPTEEPPPVERDLVIWETMFPIEAEEVVQLPAVEMFAPFAAPTPVEEPLAPAPVEPVPVAIPLEPRGLIPAQATEWTREFPDVVEATKGRMPKWILWNYGWQPPPAMGLVKTIKKDWDLGFIFDQVLDTIGDPWWQRSVAESAHTGEPAILELQEIGRVGNPYQDVARFFGVPDSLIDAYARDPEGAALLWEEVLGPLLSRFRKAMDILKPGGVRGWFDIWPSREEGIWLKYVEAAHRPENV